MLNMGASPYFSMLKVLLWVLVVFVQTDRVHNAGCLVEERIGLLHFKSFLQYSIPNPNSKFLLPSWVDDSNISTDSCCAWERVTCNSTTGHVIQLSLGNLMNIDPDDYAYVRYQYQLERPRWLLNVSLLEPFKELRSLDLSFNVITGCIPDEGFEKLSTLMNLEILNLGYNLFDDNSILQSLGAITSLKTLNLTGNYLEGYFPAQELVTLRKLSTLDISCNNYNGTLPNQGFERLAILRNLETLILDDNNFGNNIIPSLSNLTSLIRLSLSRINLGGQRVNVEGFEKLSTLMNLEILNLGYNFFGDNSILQSLGAITSLKTLILTVNSLEGYFPAQELVMLRNLNTLDISYNFYNGTLPNQGFERLAILRNLETLILDFNNFGGNIIPSLSNLTSLITLSLSRNYLGDQRVNVEDWKILSRLENLEILDLSQNSLNDSSTVLQSIATIKSLKNLNLASNDLTGSFPIKDLANLSKLEILDISANRLTGSVSPSIGELFSLKALSLFFNELNGTLPAREFCKLKKLEELDLSHNRFEGILPPCINNMTSLRLLDVSQNHFKGNIPSYMEASQTSLEHIDFSYNQFEGLFSLSSFANHSKLEVFSFSNENNKLEIETENPTGWAPLFQLKVLRISNCSLNKLASNIPTFLLDQHELELIDLSSNKLKGSFPNWLVENNTRLKALKLRDNLFSGQLHFQLQQHTISHMDASNNHMEGKLQENIGKMFPNLYNLNLSHNNFEGNLPSSVGDITFLGFLDLSFNKFSGETPRELASNASQLIYLNLGYNSFHGEILLEPFKSTWFLQMSGNQFTSILPILNSTESRLYYLDISCNDISGAIRKGLGNITSLRTLLVANNSLYGRIPCELSHAMVTLDLSHNLFTGPLPVCLNLPELEYLYLQGNKFTGSIPKVLFNSSSLLILDMRDNCFSGSISVETKQLQDLKVLLLSGNHFTGVIPNQLCLLKMISIMDLSKNAFFGTIPQCFHNIYFGKIGDSNYDYRRRWYNGDSLITPIFSKAILYMYKGFLERMVESFQDYTHRDVEVKIEFVNKYCTLSYKGSVLGLMSGLDLSCNNLTGGIPLELGQISSIIALNLSYNQLDGTIPKTFSNLAHLESLDLSHNNLSGEIPSSLIDLNFLAVFNVAHNNLSGKVPDMKAQFGTFEKSSYEGNLFLCGPPLDKSCSNETESGPTPTQSSDASDDKWYEVDPVVFRICFSVSYIIFFFIVLILLYINPYWLQRCYNFMEDLIYSCYYYIF